MHYKKTVLKNGLTILEVPSTDAESVVVDFFVKTGSRSEAPREGGISHFLEHFLFKGTKKFPTALSINEIVDGIGGEMNAFTSKESTQYYIKASSKHLTLIFEILTDMLQNPLLDGEELEREKGVIIEEMNMYKDSPQASIGDILEQTMWPGHPLGADIIGTKDTVTSFTRKDFQSYLKKFYQVNNIILGVSGKYDPKELQGLIKKHWENVPSRTVGSFKKITDGQKEPRLALQFRKTEQAHLAFGFKGFPYGDKRNRSIAVMSAILGGGMSSRLFTEVRERRGLAYFVRCGPGHFQDTGIFTVTAGVQVAKVQEAVQVILAEIKKIKDYPVSEEELKKAKEYLKGKTTLALEDNQSRLDWFLDQVAFHPNIRTPGEVYDRVDQVTVEDVQQAAKDLFKESLLTLAVIGPYKQEKMFKPLLSL